MASVADQPATACPRQCNSIWVCGPSEVQYGTERIEQLMNTVKRCNAWELVEAFESSIEAFRKGRKAFDDTTLLVARLI